jgi:hypothetical protein
MQSEYIFPGKLLFAIRITIVQPLLAEVIHQLPFTHEFPR